MKRRKRIALALGVVLTIIIGDFGLHVHAILTAPPSIEEMRLAHPRPASYWSREFVLEYRNIHNDLTDAGYWKLRDYAGRAYHFTNGQRLVVGAPESASRTVWLFGNSGLVDPWLPDDLTAATHLQALLGPSWRVVSQSANGQVALGQLVWLRETPIRAGDMVVFVDGAMDAGFILKNPDRAGEIGRYNAVVEDARRYTEAHGAEFWHFLQPYIDDSIDPALRYMDGVPLNVPSEMFIDSSHMDENGAEVEAHQIFGWLTIY